MSKFRTNTHDAPRPKPKVISRPGTIPGNEVQVIDGKGRLRGLVGRNATAATAARFHGQLGSTLGVRNGAPAWIAPTLGAVSAEGSATPGAQGDTLADKSSEGVTATQVKGGSNGG